jgi:hypothetical protein
MAAGDARAPASSEMKPRLFDSDARFFHHAAAATKVPRAFQRVIEKTIFETIVTR